jgi:DNA repair protein RadC
MMDQVNCAYCRKDLHHIFETPFGVKISSMMMHDLHHSLRPGDKLLAMGAESLTDSELLAVLMRTGTLGQSVLSFSQHLLDRFDGLAGLLQATPRTLQSIKGLGGETRRAQMCCIRAFNARLLPTVTNA